MSRKHIQFGSITFARGPNGSRPATDLAGPLRKAWKTATICLKFQVHQGDPGLGLVGGGYPARSPIRLSSSRVTGARGLSSSRPCDIGYCLNSCSIFDGTCCLPASADSTKK